MSSSLRIIVAGLVGLFPVGGVAWDYLQYVIGLARLGHDVYYHEDTWQWPYHPIERQNTLRGDYSAQHIADFFRLYAPELSSRWHYLHLHETSFGMGSRAFDEVARTADVFLNVSGACIVPESLSSQCTKVFLDTDPGYNQIVLNERFPWSENVEQWCASVAAHDRHLTYAENIQGADCSIPKVGLDWKTTRMPIVLDRWEALARVRPTKGTPWTTVMSWQPFRGKLIYRGVEYKSKGSEFEKLLELPQYVDAPLRIAAGGKETPLQQLASHGWKVVDGPSATLTPALYQKFIAGSRGELSPAKHVYVATRSGWFSCRSACYLAAGRPVVVQDTGFGIALPVGEGIVTFTTGEEATARIREVEADYQRHAKAARAIAEKYFDSNKVLNQLIDEVLS